jgi:hypothetical protein
MLERRLNLRQVVNKGVPTELQTAINFIISEVSRMRDL